MVRKILEAVLAYIEELERKYRLRTIGQLKERIRQDIRAQAEG
ncbi:MAG: hypothetical protein ACTSXC_07295 [Candidatus Freyarchaeota archaeon]